MEGARKEIVRRREIREKDKGKVIVRVESVLVEILK
jgi:hypothetical protein